MRMAIDGACVVSAVLILGMIDTSSKYVYYVHNLLQVKVNKPKCISTEKEGEGETLHYGYIALWRPGCAVPLATRKCT